MDTHCTAQEDIGEDKGFLGVHVVAQDEFNGKEWVIRWLESQPSDTHWEESRYLEKFGNELEGEAWGSVGTGMNMRVKVFNC